MSQEFSHVRIRFQAFIGQRLAKADRLAPQFFYRYSIASAITGSLEIVLWAAGVSYMFLKFPSIAQKMMPSRPLKDIQGQWRICITP
jgi:hypothetical protein